MTTRRRLTASVVALAVSILPVFAQPVVAQPVVTSSAASEVPRNGDDGTDIAPLVQRDFPTLAAPPGSAEADRPFVAVLPRRLMDTRSGIGAPRGNVPANTTQRLRVTGPGTGNADVATAVALNVTALNSPLFGFVTVWPCNVAKPSTSNLNFAAGQTIPNAVVTSISGDGYICLEASAPVGLIVDTSGWFPAGSYVKPKTPSRLVDTRDTGIIAANAPLEIAVTGRFDVPADASATMLNVTIVNPVNDGFATVYPCGQPIPTASNINFTAGHNVPNLVLAAAGLGGRTCIVSSATTHILADVTAWFPPNADIKAQTPVRILDTRIARPESSQPGLINAGETLTVPLRLPSESQPRVLFGAVINVTVTGPRRPGFVTVWSCGSRPTASNLNFITGVDSANLVMTASNASGNICIYSDAATDLIVDVSGLFDTRIGHHALPFASPATVALPFAHSNTVTTGPAVPAPTTAPQAWIGGNFSTTFMPRADWGYLTEAETPKFIGQLTITFSDGATYRCSGTVVALDVILTAGHCVVDYPTPETTPLPHLALSVSFAPGLYGSNAIGEWHTTSASDIHPSDGYFDDRRADTSPRSIDNTANDWALIKLAPSGGRHIGAVTGIVPVAPNLGRSTLPKVSMHYPAGGFFSSHCAGPGCQPVYCVSPNPPVYGSETSGRYVVGLGCPLMNGSSGGGIFSFSSGQWWTVSVVSRGPDQNIAGDPTDPLDPIDRGAYTVNTIGPELNADAYPDLLARASA